MLFRCYRHVFHFNPIDIFLDSHNRSGVTNAVFSLDCIASSIRAIGRHTLPLRDFAAKRTCDNQGLTCDNQLPTVQPLFKCCRVLVYWFDVFCRYFMPPIFAVSQSSGPSCEMKFSCALLRMRTLGAQIARSRLLTVHPVIVRCVYSLLSASLYLDYLWQRRPSVYSSSLILLPNCCLDLTKPLFPQGAG